MPGTIPTTLHVLYNMLCLLFLTTHEVCKGISKCLWKIELKDKFILIQKTVKFMHNFFLLGIFHELLEDIFEYSRPNFVNDKTRALGRVGLQVRSQHLRPANLNSQPLCMEITSTGGRDVIFGVTFSIKTEKVNHSTRVSMKCYTISLFLYYTTSKT